jgi:hypothetical protein
MEIEKTVIVNRVGLSRETRHILTGRYAIENRFSRGST